MGQVSYVEPGETIVDGVVNYKTRIEFVEESVGEEVNLDPRIKSGLSATVVIEVAKEDRVVFVPSYSVYEDEEGEHYVMKYDIAGSVKTPVEVGITGSDGSMEIISGLREGDKVVFERE